MAMSSWAKRLEIATNVAILCAVLLVAALAAKRLWEPSSTRSSGPSIGTKVSLQGIDWSKSSQNLVLALSTGCRFCSESADFYQRLVPSATSNGIRVLAVLPQPISDGRSYLEKLGIPLSDVVQSPLGAVDVSGTPTVLLVDRQGRIRKAWVGKLDPEHEQQVIAACNDQNHELAGTSPVTTQKGKTQ
jgi:peroxiredoxin